MIDFWLDNRRPLVLSDATQNVHGLFHNFKTRFYAAVLENLTGLRVHAYDVGPWETKRLQ